MNFKKEIKITLPFAPRTKKNHSQVIRLGSSFKVLPSKAYIALEKQCCKYLAMNWKQATIDTPINLECHFYKEADRKGDLVGYLQAIQDILVKANVIADDNHKIVESTDGSRVHLDRDNARIEVIIQCT
jgi:Holliday junction resolvase RusA-like endonuclease